MENNLLELRIWMGNGGRKGLKCVLGSNQRGLQEPRTALDSVGFGNH